MKQGKILIFSAPSGSGKTTIVKELLSKADLPLEYSISATSRSPRADEKDGKDYYFITPQEFRRGIAAGEFLEYEEVYPGTFYGTLKSELSRIWDKGHAVVFDVDVVGGMNIKRMYPDNSLSMFVMPPSVDELRRRLVGRGTDTADKIEVRLAKAEREMGFSKGFDYILVNDDLEKAKTEAEKVVREFLRK